jgi:hypothetical protein
MEGVRPWHIILIAAAVLAVTGSVLYQCYGTEKVEISDTLVVADIVTGDLYESPRPSGQTLFFPLQLPGSSSKTLMPAFQKDGKWYISPNYRGMAESALPPGSKPAWDKSSGEIMAKSPTPEKKKLF